MGFLSFIKNKKKNDEFDDLYSEDLYEKIRKRHEEKNSLKEDEAGISIDLDKDVIEEAYKEELSMNSERIDKSYIENYCEQIAISSKRVEDAKKEYNLVGSYLNDILAIENAERPIKKEMMYYAKRIMTLREDKKSLKTYSTKMSEKKFTYMQAHEKEISEILKDMYDDEQYCQSLKTDIHHIEGEKQALIYERKYAVKMLNKIRSFAKGILFLLFATLIMFIILGQVFELDMLIPTLFVMTIGASAAAFIVVFNQHQTNELKMSEKKLNRAIELMNSYKLKYVNVKSRLDYEYEKNNVKSSYELNEIWRVYLVVKKEREAILRTSDEIYKAMDGLLDVLDKLKLFDSSVWTSQVEAIVEPREMVEIRHTLNVRRQKLRESIEFNSRLMEKNKEKINRLIKENPSITKEVLGLLEKYENV